MQDLRFPPAFLARFHPAALTNFGITHPVVLAERRSAAFSKRIVVFGLMFANCNSGMEGKEEQSSIRLGPAGMRDIAIFLLAGGAIVWFMRAVSSVAIPLVLAILLSYALEPVVSWLEWRRIPRVAGAALLLLSLVTGIGMGVYFLSGDVIAFVENLPRAAENFRDRIQLSRATDVAEKVEAAASAIEHTAVEAAAADRQPEPSDVQRVRIEEKPLDLGGIIIWGSVGAIIAIGQITFILFLVYFLLISGDLFRRKLIRLAGPTLERKRITVEILNEIYASISRYVVVLLIRGILVAVATAAALYWIGLERAVVWGLLAGIFNSVPYVGPLAVTSAIAAAAFLQFETLEMTLYASLAAGGITALDGYLLAPIILGKAARVNSVAILVGLLVGAWIWSVAGMLLATPILAIMKTSCDRIEGLKPIGELLGE